MSPPARIHVSGPSNTKQLNFSGSRENVCLYNKGAPFRKRRGREAGWLNLWQACISIIERGARTSWCILPHDWYSSMYRTRSSLSTSTQAHKRKRIKPLSFPSLNSSLPFSLSWPLFFFLSFSSPPPRVKFSFTVHDHSIYLVDTSHRGWTELVEGKKEGKINSIKIYCSSSRWVSVRRTRRPFSSPC